MKKISWVLCITAVICGVIGWAGYRAQPEEIEVKTLSLTASFVAQTVSCTGKVEDSAAQEVRAEESCVIGEVLVESGATVKEGEPLFRVDREATLKVLAQSDASFAVKNAMNDTAPTEIVAPASGRISQLSFHEGDTVDKDSICAVIEETEPVQIRLSIPERSIRRVAVGQSVLVSGVGFQQDSYHGVIREISSTAKEKLNGTVTETTVEAVVSLNEGESDESLRVGLSAKAAITVSGEPNGFIIPYEAVLEDEKNREYVYVLVGNRAEKRTFTPKAELSDGYLVTEEFQNGDQVILTPELVTENAVLTKTEEDRPDDR